MLVVNVFGVALIGFIVWWFWLYKAPSSLATQKIITVDSGTYQPSHIKLSAGQASTMEFFRKDSSPCSELVIFPELDISENLTLNKVTKIDLPAMEPGEYDFYCQMQMYRGKLIVE